MKGRYLPQAPKYCRGCQNLRYRPDILNTSNTTVIPAWSSPGTYLCPIYGVRGPATHEPIPATPTCKRG